MSYYADEYVARVEDALLGCQNIYTSAEREDIAKVALDAVAPAIAARALREAAESLMNSIADFEPKSDALLSYINCTTMDAEALRARADEIEAGR